MPIIVNTSNYPNRINVQAVERGPRGDKGDKGDSATGFVINASIALGGHRIVKSDGTGAATYASNNDLSSSYGILGMTTGAAAQGAPLSIQESGRIIEPSWNWIPSQPIYLGIDGTLTQTPPNKTAGAVFILVVGFAMTSTSIYIHIREPIILT
jgi:hypothetical protein